MLPRKSRTRQTATGPGSSKNSNSTGTNDSGEARKETQEVRRGQQVHSSTGDGGRTLRATSSNRTSSSRERRSSNSTTASSPAHSKRGRSTSQEDPAQDTVRSLRSRSSASSPQQSGSSKASQAKGKGKVSSSPEKGRGKAKGKGKAPARVESSSRKRHTPESPQPSPPSKRANSKKGKGKAKEKSPNSATMDPSGNGDGDGPFSNLQGILRKLGGGGTGLEEFFGGGFLQQRAKTLLTHLKDDDESLKLEALTELCDMFSMGSEDSMSNFPIDSFVPVIGSILNYEHNPDLMLFAARTLTHLMDAVPASCTSVAQHGVAQSLVTKLLSIEYIDLAEQSLQAIEKLSHEQPSSILQAGGLTAVLAYLDFFPTGVQRVAVSTAANICRNAPPEDFGLVKDSLPIIRNLLQYSDQKIVEKAFLSFFRLTSSYHASPSNLEQLALDELPKQLLSFVNPSQESSNVAASTLTGILRMIGTMCHGSPKLTQEFLELGIADILATLLGNAPDSEAPAPQRNSGEDTNSSPSFAVQGERLLEVVALANELLPALPNQVSQGLGQTPQGSGTSTSNNRTGNSRWSLGRRSSSNNSGSGNNNKSTPDTRPIRREMFEKNMGLLRRIGDRLLFTLCQAYSSSVSSHVRQSCLSCIVRYLHLAPAQMLKELLLDIPISSFIAGLLGASNPVVVLVGLTMGETLMEKLPVIFTKHFMREGVVHGVASLSSEGMNSADKDDAGATKIESPTSVEELNKMVMNRANSFRETYFSANHSLEGGSKVLNELKAAGVELLNSAGFSSLNSRVPIPAPLEDLTDTSALIAIHNMLTDAEGVSTFEFLSSEVAERILEYLCIPDNPQSTANSSNASNLQLQGRQLFRLQTFAHIFLGYPSPCESGAPANVRRLSKNRSMGGSSNVLVQKLQESLHFVEAVPIFVEATDSPQTGLRLLTSTFKLRLEATDESLKDYSSNVVMIEPLATIGAIIDFLWSKIGSEGEEAERASSKTEKYRFKSRFLRGNKGGGSESEPPEGEDEAMVPDEEESEEPVEDEEIMSGDEDFYDDEGDDEDALLLGDEDASLAVLGGEEYNDEEGDVHDVEVSSPAALRRRKSSSGSQPRTPELTGKKEKEKDVRRRSSSGGSSKAPARKGSKSPGMSGKANKEKEKEGKEKEKEKEKEKKPSQKLSLSLNGHDLPPTMTIIQCVQKYGKATPASNPTSGLGSMIPPQLREASGIAAATLQLWRNIHTLQYKLAKDEGTSTSKNSDSSCSSKHNSASSPLISQAAVFSSVLQTELPNMPSDSGIDPKTSAILSCLRVVNFLNVNPREVYPFPKRDLEIALPSSEFINAKLTAKILRQLQDPLRLCSGNLPSWCRYLVHTCPFLFPLDARRVFLHSSAFGISRALQLYQQRSNDGQHADSRGAEFKVSRIQRQKVRISRDRILESAIKVMELYASHRAVLEVEYFGEVGTGLGPTLEFYTLVSKELQCVQLGMWRSQETPKSTDGDGKEDEKKDEKKEKKQKDDKHMVNAPRGLFPNLLAACDSTHEKSTATKFRSQLLDLFQFFGRFIAKALLDSRLVDIPLSTPFYKLIRGESLTLSDLALVEPEMASSLQTLQLVAGDYEDLKKNNPSDKELEEARKQLCVDGCPVDDLCLDFTVPGLPSVSVRPEGVDKDAVVTLETLQVYVDGVLKYLLRDGIQQQVDAFRKGFSEVFPIEELRAFNCEEIETLIRGSPEKWDVASLMEVTKCDHGYSHSSQAVKFLLEILSEFTPQEQSDFLQFVTGCPRLPFGGLSGLTPPLTIVRKGTEDDESPNSHLPSCSTCFYYLKLPDYTSKEIMKERLMYAIQEGQNNFHLS